MSAITDLHAGVPITDLDAGLDALVERLAAQGDQPRADRDLLQRRPPYEDATVTAVLDAPEREMLNYVADIQNLPD